MQIDPTNPDALMSARRMEIKSKSAICGGIFHEDETTVIGGTDVVPDPHFNRISVLDPDKFDAAALTECLAKMVEGTPAFIDVPHPTPENTKGLLLENGYHFTEESRSSMLLTDFDNTEGGTDELDIEILEPGTIDTYLDIFLRGFDTPEEMIPLASALLRELVIRNFFPDMFRHYLGVFRGEPAATLYLFFEGDEGGINWVATKRELRGKGIASAMMRRCVDDAKELGVRLLSLETGWDSAPERLYKRLGFTTIGRHEVFTNTPELKYGP